MDVAPSPSHRPATTITARDTNEYRTIYGFSTGNDSFVGTYAAITFLVVLELSLSIIPTGTIALVRTGLLRDRAFLQSMSAFSGVGFTTEEAEDVMSTPSRRRIFRTLILFGNVGIGTGIAALVLFFSGSGSESGVFRFSYLVIGAGSLILLARSQWFDRPVTPIINWGLNRPTSFDPYDYRQLLRLHNGYSVAKIQVDENGWLANSTLDELNSNAGDVLSLGILRRDGSYLGAPAGDRTIEPGDTLLAYGRKARLSGLPSLDQADNSLSESK